MVKNAEVLAVVQARGGSKGIPRKNLSMLGGHPLIAYSIASALAAKSVTRVIVSTDDETIMQTARHYGAEVPFLRPPDLATDAAADFPLFEHALQWLETNQNYRPHVVLQLRPTTPLRPRGLIDEAVRLLLDDPLADCVRGATRPHENPYKMWRMDGNGYLTPLLQNEFTEPYNMPRQMLPTIYWQTGHIDVIRYETIVGQKSLTGRKVRSIVVDPKYCIDIDTPRDLEFASWRLQQESLEIDSPQGTVPLQRSWPDPVSLVVFDFDGVFTDNRVWVMEDGREAVACHRGDGMGVTLLRKRGIESIVLSTEVNPVVTARCEKLGLLCQQALNDKLTTLERLAAERSVDLKNVIYLGNDVNDTECLRRVGFAVVVADAHPSALAEADLVLQNRGGYGAVRELCDLILERMQGSNS